MKVRDEEDEVCLIEEATMWAKRDIADNRCRFLLPDEPFLALGLDKPANDVENIEYEYMVYSRYTCFIAAYRAAMQKERPDLLRDAPFDQVIVALGRYGALIAKQRRDAEYDPPPSEGCIFIPHTEENQRVCSYLYGCIARGYLNAIREVQSRTEDEE